MPGNDSSNFTPSTLRSGLDAIEVFHPTLAGAVRSLEASALYSLAVAESDRAASHDRMYASHLALELATLLKRFRRDIGKEVG